MLETARSRRLRSAWLAALVVLGGCGSSANICARTPPTGSGAGAPFASRIPLGAAVRWKLIESDPGYRNFFRTHYEWLTPENELKMFALEPERGEFDYETADALVNWALAQGKSVHGHVLIWGQQLPGWLSNVHSATDAGRIMATYIHTLLTHFRGRIHEWDVVNEAFNADGTYTQNFWLRHLGPAYIGEAFRLARATDPRLKLCYNDQGIELPGPHANAVLRLVKQLRRQGLLDCVGLEVHTTPPAASLQAVRNELRRFAATGAYALISEMDVSVESIPGSTAQRLAAQARVYGTYALACRETARCVRFTTWGFTDASSWLGSSADALPFDSNCQAKPAWVAIRTALER
jgi:endo-1,4-beta-xylanase